MINKKLFPVMLCLSFAVIFGLSQMSVAQVNLIDPEIEQKVSDLLSQMTLEEKVGQLNQHNGSWDVTGPIPENNEYVAERARLLKGGGVGSLLNVVGAEATLAAQKLAVENSRLGIPLVFGYDVVHGFKTIFPIC